MALAKRTLGAAAAAAILAAVTISARLADGDGPFQRNARPSSAAPLFCAGVRLGTSEPGLACAADRRSFLAEAARAGLAPSRCKAATLPLRASIGSLVTVVERGGACAVTEVGRLPAATALMCGALLEVNSASEADLALLPGIGEVRARNIAESRRREGPFPDVESLDRVRGIGPKTVEGLRPWLTVDAGR
jgi:competence ComEA-like helix-hairpin-helix protein